VIDLVISKGAFIGDAINVGNGEETFIKEAVSLFYGLWDKKAEYAFSGEERKGDPNNWVSDIGKLKSLGYQSGTNLEEGLKKYCGWLIKRDLG